MTLRRPLSRRRFLAVTAASTAISAVGGIARPYLSRAADRPVITHGIQSGDVTNDSAVVWARADRPGPHVGRRSRPATASRPSTAPSSSMRCLKPTSRQRVDRWPARRPGHLLSHPLPGPRLADHHRRAGDRPLSQRAADRRSVSFVWSGDTAGQGWASTRRGAACAPTRPCCATARFLHP